MSRDDYWVFPSTSKAEFVRIEHRWAAADLEPAIQLRRSMRIVIPIAVALAGLAMFVVIWNRRLSIETKLRRASEQRLVDMTERLDTGVFQYRMKPNGVVELLFANSAFRTLYRVPDDVNEVAERDFLNHIEHVEWQRVAQAWRRAHEQSSPFAEIYRFRYPDGSKGWLSFQSKPRRNSDNSEIWNGYVVNLSHEREVQEQLRLLLQAKDIFVATASHELKTPLHSFSLTLQWLKRRYPKDPELQEAVRLADASTRSLAVFIDDLLDLNQIETGRMTLRLAPLELAKLLKDLVDSFRPALSNKGLKLELELSPALPKYVIADAIRLRQVIINLLGNSIKHTLNGRITVRVEATLEKESQPGDGTAQGSRVRVDFKVVDTGPGIATDRIATIFEPFSGRAGADEQSITSHSPETRSTGLGLSICRRLVELMGGTIELSSTLGAGTCVRFHLTFEIPTDICQIKPFVESNISEGSIQLSPCAVLMVDDDPLSRSILADLLSERGFDVVQADNGAQALALWERSHFNVVISDLRMPSMSGVELIRQLRSRVIVGTDFPRCKFIALSASRLLVDPKEESELLFDHVLEKPVMVEEILAILAADGDTVTAATIVDGK